MAASLTKLPTLWKTFSEIDINAIREEAQNTPRLAVIGSATKTGAFQSLLQHGPLSAEQMVTAVPSFSLPLSASDLNALAGYDLRIVLVDEAEQLKRDDLTALLRQAAPTAVVQEPLRYGQVTVDPVQGGSASARVRSLVLALDDEKAVKEDLLPALVQLLPDREMAAGRAYPGLRPAVANRLIQNTGRANAMYAAGTGLAEFIPVLGVPFALADVYILTKNQIVLAYRLGMIMGENGTLTEIIPKVAGVVGAGFIWRQIARELLGFLPLGVVLKTAIAYAGTITTGQAVYHYFTTGERLRGQDLRQLFNEAIATGRAIAAQTVGRVTSSGDNADLSASNGRAPRRKVKLPFVKR